MSKLKTVTPKELHDWGLIFEINRRVLHPLGLAIAVEVENETVSFSDDVWDYRDDPEGIIFGEEGFEQGAQKLEKFMSAFGFDKHGEREETLGFIVQSSAEQGREE